jgi:soluble cytochrome b562
MSDVVTMPDRMTAVYVTKALEGFIKDPPDNEYQEGFCEAMCVIGEECLLAPAGLIERARAARKKAEKL